MTDSSKNNKKKVQNEKTKTLNETIEKKEEKESKEKNEDRGDYYREKYLNNQEMSPVRRDIMIVLILLAAILLFVSNLGLLGPVGYVISSLLFGLFGLPAYVFPIVGAYLALVAIANRDPKLYRKRLIGVIGFYILVCAFCQMVMNGFDSTYMVFQAFLDSANDHIGGGFFGCCISQLFGCLIGVIGTYIVIVIGMIIFAIIATQRPLVSNMGRRSKDAYDRRREDFKKKKAQRLSERRRDDADTDYDVSEDEDIPDPEAMTSATRKTLLTETKLEKRTDSGTENKNDVFDDYLNSKFKGNTKPDDPGTSSAFILPQLDLAPELFDNKEETSENAENTEIIDFLPDLGIGQDKEDDSPDEFNVEETTDKIDNNRTDSEFNDENGYSENEEPEYTEQQVNDSLVEIQQVIPAAADSTDTDAPPPKKTVKKVYRKPPIALLNKGTGSNSKEQNAQVRETAAKLQQTLHNFGVEATVINASCGPTVTRYELQPEQGVKVSKIVNLTDDIKLNLAAPDIRIEAPIPGKAAVGIEVPNKTNNVVMLRELIDTPEFKNSKSKLSITVGKDLAGKPVISDIAKMPHLLIAGSTGSGKSVCINTFIMSILYKADPDEVKLILVDPKVVELSIYNGIPHLLCPVVTEPKKAAGALQWAVQEMTRRYNLFAEFSVRDLKGYNAKVAEIAPSANENETKPEILPQIVIIVDELADLMMVAPGEVEEAICRLAQLARAAGLHLIIATQRPSVNVITGLIKANMPSRIALSVTSGIDSRVIIDMNGAEKLLGHGDMLFYPAGYQKPARLQGGFVSDEEIEKVVEFLKNKDVEYDNSIEEAMNSASISSASAAPSASADDRDAYFLEAGKFIIEKDKASIGMLQRVFKIGFNRAARIMDQLCEAGVVGEEEGTKPRKILMTLEQFENYIEEN